MRFYFITFRSVTFAQRAEKLLNQRSYRPNLLRTPRWMEEQGCGYCLKLYAPDIGEVVQMLRRSKVPMRKVYVQHAGGQLEEVGI